MNGRVCYVVWLCICEYLLHVYFVWLCNGAALFSRRQHGWARLGAFPMCLPVHRLTLLSSDTSPCCHDVSPKKGRKRKWSGGGSGARRSSALRSGHGGGGNLGETGLSDDEIDSGSDGSDSSGDGFSDDDEDDLSEGADDVDVAVAAFLSGVAQEDESDFSDDDGGGEDAEEGVDGAGAEEEARREGGDEGGGTRSWGGDGGGGRGESKAKGRGHKESMRYVSFEVVPGYGLFGEVIRIMLCWT